MKSKILFFIVGAFFVLWAGYTMFMSPQIRKEMNMDSMEAMHSHAMLEVDKESPVPEISIKAYKDKKDGYNIHIMTENFSFAPTKVNGLPTQGEGHAHLYVNEEKIARVYGEWFHVSADLLEYGENIIEVTLNANDHSEWIVDGVHIADQVVINI